MAKNTIKINVELGENFGTVIVNKMLICSLQRILTDQDEENLRVNLIAE